MQHFNGDRVRDVNVMICGFSFLGRLSERIQYVQKEPQSLSVGWFPGAPFSGEFGYGLVDDNE